MQHRYSTLSINYSLQFYLTCQNISDDVQFDEYTSVSSTPSVQKYVYLT